MELSEVKSLSCVRLFVTQWSVAPQSVGFSRQEYWSRLPFPSPGDLPNPGIELGSPALQTDALPSEPPGKPQAPNIKGVLRIVWWLHGMRQGFVKRKLHRASDIWPESCTKTRDLLREKKMGKEDNRGWKACKEWFWEKWLSNERHEGFFCASFFICISNRKSLTLAIQQNSVCCWWNDTWAITKIHEHFPMENPHKVCCFSQIHESVKQKGL